ncbi:MAG: hypothetical protein H6621_05910 [Halobacteriovoraceae bacterium]|nr:hypothetical protein [Halobacteriovoraceae bacterium]
MNDYINIEGARVNNLKSVCVKIPLNKISCFTGPSGSGKSSLAFHTILAESKRRLINCFPNSFKFFSDKPPAVDVDVMKPILPVFGLPQINPIKGSRTVVSDSLGLTALIQSLYYHLAKEFCPKHHKELASQSLSSQFQSKEKKLKNTDVVHVFLPKTQFMHFYSMNVLPPRVYSVENKEIVGFDKSELFWEVARFKGDKLEKLDTLFEKEIMNEIQKFFYVIKDQNEIKEFSVVSNKKCPSCDVQSTENININIFSPQNSYGACSNCNGFGANLVIDRKKIVDERKTIDEDGLKILNHKKLTRHKASLIAELKKSKISTKKPIEELGENFWEIFQKGKGKWPGIDKLLQYFESKKYKPSVRIFLRRIQKEETCPVCKGSRISEKIHNFYLNDKNLSDFYNFEIDEALEFIRSLKSKDKQVLKNINKIINVLETSQEIGLGHLSLKRKAKTLSAGEYQRVLLVKYLSFEGTDSLFIFDEPSVGLDDEQQLMLIKGLRKIQDQGNTIILVDHSEKMVKNADTVYLMGPGAGSKGGEIIYSGQYKSNLLDLKKAAKDKNFKRKKVKEFIKVQKPEIYGQQYSDFKIPLNSLVWVNGPTGSGKSSVLVNLVANEIHYQVKNEYLFDLEGSLKSVNLPKGVDINSLIVVDANLNRYTSRSTVGSITDLANPVRKYFAKLPISKSMGLVDGNFSSNSPLGQCLKCEGKGVEIIEMPYFEDIVLTCDECHGTRLKPEISSISDGHFTVAEAFQEPIEKILSHIPLTPKYTRIFESLKKLNLDYLSLDRNVSTLSGGEKQRIYLLSKILSLTAGQIIVIENLSFGLSQLEMKNVLSFLRELTDEGQSILVIDYNKYFNNYADYELKFDKNGNISCQSIS